MAGRNVVVIGGGAAGFFYAINYKEAHPEDDVTIYEQSKNLLSKVKVSGGGRCNVTHACFDPKELTAFYPRGARELLGPFHRFACGDTVGWFESRGVPLKIEQDGRMFPESDQSATIIQCFMAEASRLKIKIERQSRIDITSLEEGILTINREIEICPDIIFIATGASKKVWSMLKANGVEIVDPVPSLFTFNIRDKRLKGLSGIAFEDVRVVSEFNQYNSSGPLLITHWGLSAPSVLKLSSVEAREMAEARYRFSIWVDFLPDKSRDEVMLIIRQQGGRRIGEKNPFGLPRRYWNRIVEVSGMNDQVRWADMKKEDTQRIVVQLKKSHFQVNGKSTFKEEFVSAGGIDLKEVNFKDFSLKNYPWVYVAGEVLNIDAMTGGFNFQAAWTGSFIAATNA